MKMTTWIGIGATTTSTFAHAASWTQAADRLIVGHEHSTVFHGADSMALDGRRPHDGLRAYRRGAESFLSFLGS